MLYMWPSMYCLLFVCLSVCFLGCLFRIVFLRLKVVCLKLVCLRLKCFMIFRRPTYCGLSKCMVKQSSQLDCEIPKIRSRKGTESGLWSRKYSEQGQGYSARQTAPWQFLSSQNPDDSLRENLKLCKSCRAGTEQTGPRLSAKLCETLEIIAVYKTEQ